MCGLGFTCLFCFPDCLRCWQRIILSKLQSMGGFGNLLSPGKNEKSFIKSCQSFANSETPKRRSYVGSCLHLLPVVRAQLCLLASRRPKTISGLLTVLRARTFCKLWTFCPASLPTTDGKAARMARTGGWRGCLL